MTKIMGRPIIKVANIIEEGRLGGPQIRIFRVARHLNDHDVETTVIFPQFQSDLFKQTLTDGGVRNLSLPLHRLTKDKKHLIAYFYYFFRELTELYKLFSKEQFDVIHCSGGSWQFKGVIAGKLAGSKTLWHLNDTGMPSMLRLFFRIIAPRFADGLIVAGKQVREYYVDRLGTDQMPIFEIQAPVDTKLFNPRTSSIDETISGASGLKIVTIANVDPIKGMHHFIEMASLLNRQYKDVNYFIVGSVFNNHERYQRNLTRQMEVLGVDNLTFYGPSKRVASILKSSDIFVFPSVSEASPTSVWEAMSMEKAIVSTDVGDVRLFLKDGAGFVVPINDANALADRVGKLIEDSQLRKALGKKARMAAKEFLDIEIIARKHWEAYKAVLNAQ